MDLVSFFFTNGWHFAGLVVVLGILHDIVVAARRK